MRIDEFLTKFKGKKIFFKPNPGNGGDAIIAYGTIKVFKKLGLDYEIVGKNSDLKGKDVFYGGGGNLIGEYTNCAQFLSEQSGCRTLTILPHTVSGHSDVLKTLRENVTVICREIKSFEYVKSFGNIGNVLLMDDMALSLEAKDFLFRKTFINRLIYVTKPKDMLWALYHRKATIGYFLENRNKNETLNAFRVDVEKTDIAIPKDNLDLSALFNYDSSMSNETLVKRTALLIGGFLNQFEVVNTNRLHICITSAILGKKVNFYSNSYWKNESIYEFSLKERFPRINWIN
ncbi:polysaccharide pyruvyl transferase family protein [Arcticibacter sp. MXS-1]|uniref:polysaccharide pyruvyl transferase family protein n=1 Tax=Arcticibacter sp. MXS-1 TaxID=3341726 RepID=UPI0035A95B0F